MVRQITEIAAEKSTTGQIFIGLDVHKTKWSVSIYEGQFHLKTYSMEADVKQLLRKLKMAYPCCKVKLCYEAGFSGYWLQRVLEESGYECIVVNAADIPTSQYNKRRKSDKLDSKHLGLMLSRGLLEGIYVPSHEQEQIRELVRLRLSISKDKRREMNRIRAYVNRHGLELPSDLASRSLWTKRGHSWLKEMGEKHYVLKKLYEGYEFKEAEEKQIGARLREQIKQSTYEQIYEVLMSIPGIGWCTASMLIGELGSMERFRKVDQLASYCGLVPDVRSSADKVKVLGVTSRGNKRLRTALIEAAWVAQRVDHKLNRVYLHSLDQGKAKQSAIVKVARKLLARMRAIWIKQQKYEAAA